MLHLLEQILLISGILFLLIFVGIAFFNEILLFSFLLVDYSLKSLYKPKEYPPVEFTRYIKNFWREFFYIMRKYPYWPLKWCNLTLNEKSQSDTAILFVHGYCRNQTDWLWMRSQLKDFDCPIFFVNLEPTFSSIDNITKTSLIPKINHIKEHTRCKRLILVGHSMGGLVSSYFSEYLDIGDLVKAVITIGTPYGGTKIAVVGAGANAREMCPGSAFLTDLHAKMHNTAKDYYQICTKFDNKIFPWQSAVFENTDPKKQAILSYEAHLCLLRSKEVATHLKSWLQDLIQH